MAIWLAIRKWVLSILQFTFGYRRGVGSNIVVDNNIGNQDSMMSYPISTEYSSPNFSIRRIPIDSIIIHHTAGQFPGCAVWLSNPVSRVSAHYLINRAGMIFRLVNDTNKAWHAGRGAFDVDNDGIVSPVERMWNDRSLGIELEGYEQEGFKYTTEQLHALDRLVYDLCYDYRIKTNMILGHKEISPGRKVDPLNFDMNKFRQSIQTMMVA